MQEIERVPLADLRREAMLADLRRDGLEVLPVADIRLCLRDLAEAKARLVYQSMRREWLIADNWETVRDLQAANMDVVPIEELDILRRLARAVAAAVDGG